MAQFNPNDLSRFDNFDILTTTYKIVLGHEIACHVLIPKPLVEQAQGQDRSTGLRPIIFRIHGGGFVSGSTCIRHSAVIVSCDYRLAPEATIDLLIEDVDSFLKWIHTELPSFVSGRTIVQVDLRAVAAAYPLVDAKSPHFSQVYDKPMYGFPHLPTSLLDEHETKLKAKSIPSIISAEPQCARAELMFSYVQNAKYAELFPPSRRDLYLLDKIEDGARFPRGSVFIWHGKGDTVVPVEGSLKLAEKLKEFDPDLPFTLAVREGEYGFDATSSIDKQ
ncbi:Alpha/Beta hydrolase protein [Dactylonectria estremocensis]|uniref:Alpha/Beta hydrolase protein n=1 Tax=Dactylonectria estremocensis TaxID=1079267 RepID=A0A9P9DTT6_9HYPO|nr:Alpha/Beta hydrolase protein [Dactylonectria estremocensis]